MKAQSVSIRIVTADNKVINLEARDVVIQYGIEYQYDPLYIDGYRKYTENGAPPHLQFECEGQYVPVDIIDR